MQEQFVPYGLAVRLKKINFHENCMAYFFKGGKINNYFNKYYNNNKLAVIQPFAFHCTAPLWQQAFDWFREKHNLHSTIIYISKTSIDSGGYMIMIDYINPHKAILDYDSYKTHKEARQALLNKLIKIVENEKV